MNDRQEEKNNTYEACDAVLTDEAAIVDEVIALAEAHDRLQENMDGIDEAAGRKEAAIAGKGTAKREGKIRLVDALHLVAGLLVAEGTATSNPELIAQARYSRSSFLRTRDGRLPAVADAFHALATTHKTALQRRGFSDAQLDEWFAARALDETASTHASDPASAPAAGAS
ncbi:MAG: hypothetical protein EOO15_19460 [Chitinophagaceae bacterium]|nr:MAG: hypothetical protein EOO15_19460 [Chitinophagaceae bacterium]